MGDSSLTANSPTSWMAKNGVAANLLMLSFLIGGYFFAQGVRQEVFPETTLSAVSVQVQYLGASPAEVEQGVILAIEDEVRSVDGVKKVTSEANEGIGSVTVELLDSTDKSKALQDIKNAVDGIRSFPAETETPIVNLLTAKRKIITLIVSGEQDPRSLRTLTDQVRSELQNLDDITLVELAATQPLEIAIEVPQHYLRSYNLTLDDIAAIVRATALELPGGSLKTAGGEILVKTYERRSFGSEFADIVVTSSADGSVVHLGDIANIKDGFEETDLESVFNDKPAQQLNVYSVGTETPRGVSDAVYGYIESTKSLLPANVELIVFEDQSQIFQDRVTLLLNNAFLGLLLVMVILGIFLSPRLAFWVMLGLPVSFLGAFLMFNLTGATINMISLFAFIITLGVVVDDAIIVGEVIYEKRLLGMSNLDAAIYGIKEISTPIIFAVLTNIVAFMPLAFVPGSFGDIFVQIPAVVVAILAVSLIEVLFILPAHLAHKDKPSKFWDTLAIPQVRFAAWLEKFTQRRFTPAVRRAVKDRYVTLAIGVAVLAVCIGMVAGGYLKFTFVPQLESDVVTVQATLPFGAPLEQSRRVQARLIEAAQQTIQDNGGVEISKGIFSAVGAGIQGNSISSSETGGHLVSVVVSLVSSDVREIGGTEFAQAWRSITGDIAGLESLTFSGENSFGGAGAAIQVELRHSSQIIAQNAADELAETLRGYAGVIDINNGHERGKPQFSYNVKPEARSLGITANDLASQVRASFFGAEALRQQRGRDEVKVRVRLPIDDRTSLDTLETMTIRTPQNGYIPLNEAADIETGFSYTSIQRAGGNRIISVTADVDTRAANANDVLADLQAKVLPALLEAYPGLVYSFEGDDTTRREAVDALVKGLAIALFVIYALLAIPFNSYSQPIIIMVAIPFGVVGAILGHLMLGFDISIISLFGIIALSGVVINDSLVLVVAANKFKTENSETDYDAVTNAAIRRLRPILLTSLTTFFGLVPMLTESSIAAQFLIPMAVSMAFGVLFATVITLFVVPSVYMIIVDVKRLLRLTDEVELHTGKTAEIVSIP